MTGFTPEEWRTAARVARRSIFTEGNPDLADAWEKAADQAEARLIPAGGMALTAEQVEDVRLLLDELASERDECDTWDLYDRLRALFPATEPAEDAVGDPLQAWKGFLKPKPIGWYRTMELDFAAKHFGFPVKPDSGDWFTASDGGKWCSESNEWELRYYPPTPTEPAEEPPYFDVDTDPVKRVKFTPAPAEPAGDVGHGSVDDGMGSEWPRCKADCGIEVVRPGKAQCDCTEPTGEDDPDDISGFMDALKASRAHNPTPAEPIEELEPDEEPEWVQRLAEKWTSAMTAVRKSEHHYPADCLAEAVDMLLGGHLAAPAEPVKEETKAQPWIVQLPEGMTMEQWIESLPDEAPGLLAAVREVRERLGISSPVVPAPTETGPWQTVDAIPESVTRIEDCEGDVWHRCTAGWEHGGLHGPEGYAPFVAAEEG